MRESVNSIYVAQSNGLVLVFSTASGTTNPSLTIDLTAKSTALTCITQDGTTTDLFVGTNGKGIIRLTANAYKERQSQTPTLGYIEAFSTELTVAA